MRLTIRHQTTYRYREPARFAMQLLRVTPRSFEGQFVRRWRVEVDADARLERGEDAYGNITHTVFIDGPVEAVNITTEGEVETTDIGGMTRGAVERLPVPLYLRETALTRPSPAIRGMARSVWEAAAGDRLTSMHDLMARLQEEMTFQPGTTGTTTTALDAYDAKRGVCQDFAHVFIAAARALGIPARYVGGYLFRADGDEQQAGHAWAEAHIEGFGWIGFDAANGLCPTDCYVRAAIGPDYLDAAPVRGSQAGGVDETLSVSVHVAQSQWQNQDPGQSQSQSQSGGQQSQDQGLQTQSQVQIPAIDQAQGQEQD